MEQTFDPVWLVLGAIASGAITVLKKLAPPFRRWFDQKLNDEERQSLMLWIGIATVVAVCAYRLWGTPLPTDPRELLMLLVTCASGVVQTLTGQAGWFAATKKIGGGDKPAQLPAAAVVTMLPTSPKPLEDGARG